MQAGPRRNRPPWVLICLRRRADRCCHVVSERAHDRRMIFRTPVELFDQEDAILECICRRSAAEISLAHARRRAPAARPGWHRRLSVEARVGDPGDDLAAKAVTQVVLFGAAIKG